VRNAQVFRSGLLKNGYRLTKDKLLRLKHMPKSIEQFLVEWAVLTLQVKHGHRRGYGLGRAGRVAGRFNCVCHGSILAAVRNTASHRGRFEKKQPKRQFTLGRVEKVSKPLYCCHIAGLGSSGVSGIVPVAFDF
jgi:hypothetical protein